MSNPYQVREWLKDLPPQQLKMYADGKNPADVPPWLAVAEMTRRQRMQQGMKTPPQGTVKDKIESQFDQPSQDEEMDDQAKLMSLLAQRQQKGQQDQGQMAQNAPTIPENVPQPEEQPEVQYAAKGGRLNGVAGLPANIFKFAHGGIVAFNGEDDSDVKDKEKESSRLGDLWESLTGGFRGAREKSIKEAELLQQRNETGIPIWQAVTPTQRKANEAKQAEIERQLQNVRGQIPEAPKAAPAPAPAPAPAVEQDKPADQTQNVVQNRERAPVGIATRVPGSPSGSSSAVPAAPALVAPRTEDNPYVKLSQKYLDIPQEKERSFEEGLAERRKQNELLGIKPIGEGVEKRSQAYEDEYNASKKDRALSDLQMILSSFAKRNSSGKGQAGAMGETGAIRAEANRVADLNFRKAQNDKADALEQLRRAELVGDRDAIVSANEKIKTANAELRKNQGILSANIAGTAVHADTANFATAVQNAAADRQYNLSLASEQRRAAHDAAVLANQLNTPEKYLFNEIVKYKGNLPDDVLKIVQTHMSLKDKPDVERTLSLIEKRYATERPYNPMMIASEKDSTKKKQMEDANETAYKLVAAQVLWTINSASGGIRGGNPPPQSKVDTTGFGGMTSAPTKK